MTDAHLSKIATSWTLVQQAHNSNSDLQRDAQTALLEIYSDSIQRYLIASLKDQLAADEVFQEFAIKLVKGDFAAATPERGKFRAFVKTVLYRLMMDHHRRRNRHRSPGELEGIDEPTDQSPPFPELAEEEFRRHWREGLLTYAWSQLREHQNRTGGVYYSLLRTKAKNPEFNQQQLVTAVFELTGKELGSSSFRVTLHRARQKFSDFLLEAISSALENPNDEKVESELADLQLLKYKVCKDALDRIRDP